MKHDFTIAAGSAEQAIHEVALIYFRHHGATDSNAMHLTDYIMSALGDVEEEEAAEGQ